MKLRLLLSISLFALLSHKLCAQSADDFFHGGAQSYLSNNVAGAREEVDKGLKLFPDDIKLKKLDELLKQQQNQQQQQAQPAEMTPEQAKQMLDAQKNDEMMLPANRNEKPRNRQHPLKDW